MRFQQVEIPDELVTAARNGRLVIFVGAGASLDPPSSLPTFKQLVIDIGTRAASPPTPQQQEKPDLFLGDLTHLKVDVHALVAKAIDSAGSAPNRLHHAITSLAAAHPPIRVVTTNYDLHLESAARADGSHPEVFRGPALPMGDDFTGIVHLHGALDQDPRHLVVTDADFGHAYLREAWAARFLERMFAAFTVLFIGYSHGDVVMQYLARSLGRDGRRYVLTDEADSPQWPRLGLTPVHYPVVRGSHAALSEALERWTELATWGRLDHRRRIGVLVAQGPPSLPEEESYLQQALTDPENVRFFTEAASDPEWLKWVATRPQFELLFTPAAEGDPDAEEVARALTRWFVDAFGNVEDHSAAALRLVRDRTWTHDLWDTVVHRLFAQKSPIAAWQATWLLIALQRAPHSRHDLLDMMLAEDKWGGAPDLAFTLLEHRTTPIVTPGLDFGDATGTPRFEVTLAGDEHWLTRAWLDVFTPLLDHHAPDLFDLAVHQIRRTYRLARVVQPGFDPIGFGRSAIEPHPQDDFRDPHDMLIDAARDALERLLSSDPAGAAERIHRLVTASEAILRRLGLHGWRLRPDHGPDAKIQWLLESNLLFDLDLQHEVFLLLQETVADATDDPVRDLLAAIDAGPGPSADGSETAYRRYNLLAWLQQSDPTNQAVAAALAIAQNANPDYRPREHPDLNMYMTSGFVEDAEPFTPADLHTDITRDPAAALARVREFNKEEQFATRGPTWAGALAALRACVAEHPLDGITLGPHLTAADDDIRLAMIRGWGQAQLTTSQPADLAETVLALIDTWDPDVIRATAASALSDGGQAGHPTRWHEVTSARTLARRLWPDTDVAGNMSSGNDTFLEAINHPAGDLAQFWVKATATDWSRQGDAWAGLPPEIAAELDRMIDQPGRTGLLARCILIGQLRFFHGADPDWATPRLLPLLDWDTGGPEAAPLWRTFLHHGQYDDALLRAGLLDSLLATLDHDQDVADERTVKALGRTLATIAVRSDDPPTAWLPTLTTRAPAAAQLAWTRSVGRHLRDMQNDEAEAQWTRWIQEYWTGRVASIPRPLSPDEASAIASWVLGLRPVRASAIHLVEQVPAGLDPHDRILAALSDLDLAAEAPLWARYLTHLLAGTQVEEPWAICHYLAKIVPVLRERSSAEAVAPIIEEALRLRCMSAPGW